MLPSGLKFYKCIANVMIKKHWIGFSSLGTEMVQWWECSPPNDSRTRRHGHICVVHLCVVLVVGSRLRHSKFQFTGGARIKQSIGSQTLEITTNLHIDKKAIEHCVVPGNYLYPPQGGFLGKKENYEPKLKFPEGWWGAGGGVKAKNKTLWEGKR